MDPFEAVEVGSTGLKVTRLGLGGAPLSKEPPDLPDRDGAEIIRRVLSLGIRYMDTAPHYNGGRSELRYGEALAGVPRDSYAISTKVGRLLKVDGVEDVDFARIDLSNLPALESVFDYSRDAVLRSLEQSLLRLRLERVDVLLLHDVDEEHYRQAIDEAFPTLADLRSQGVVTAIGAGLGTLELLLRFAREGDFDCFLLPDRYTLIEQTAIDEFLPLCSEKSIAVIIGAPYRAGAMLGRRQQSPEEEAHLGRYRTICERYGVPIRAAALQFVAAHPAVASVIPGPASVEEVIDNIKMARHEIPPELWTEMKSDGLIAPGCPFPVE